MRTLIAALGLLAGCSGLLGIQDLRPAGDGGIDMPGGPPQHIAVTGHVQSVTMMGFQPCRCTVELVQNSAQIARATGDAQGVFRLDVTQPLPLDATLHASDGADGLIDTQFYFGSPLHGDTSTDVFVFDGAGLFLLATTAGENQPAAAVMTIVQVVDDGGTPIAGVVVSTDQLNAHVRYSDGMMLPSMDTIMTTVDGVAFIFGANPGKIVLQASKPGLMFAPRQITLVSSNVFLVELSPRVP